MVYHFQSSDVIVGVDKIRHKDQEVLQFIQHKSPQSLTLNYYRSTAQIKAKYTVNDKRNKATLHINIFERTEEAT